MKILKLFWIYCHSPNQINFATDSSSSVTSSSSATSGVGSTFRTAQWATSVIGEEITPAHTEGTPSLTESSESGDVG